MRRRQACAPADPPPDAASCQQRRGRVHRRSQSRASSDFAQTSQRHSRQQRWSLQRSGASGKDTGRALPQTHGEAVTDAGARRPTAPMTRSSRTRRPAADTPAVSARMATSAPALGPPARPTLTAARRRGSPRARQSRQHLHPTSTRHRPHLPHATQLETMLLLTGPQLIVLHTEEPYPDFILG